MTDAASAQSPTDFGQTPEGVVKRWLREIELATQAEKEWVTTADKIVKRYRGGDGKNDDGTHKPDSYNVLYANVQTIGPILYNSTPEPVVQRRFNNDDPVADEAGEVLRRAIKYAIGCQDFDEVISLAISDYQLPGRGVVEVKYVPTLAPMQGAAGSNAVGEQGRTEEVVYEEIRFDLTPWKSFRRGPGRTWQDVPWVAFELEPTRQQCIELFGDEIGPAVPLRSMQANDSATKEQVDAEQIFQRAKVWVIWDKDGRQVVWICPDVPTMPLKTLGDEYNLSGFFNVPRPLYAVETSDSLVPVPEFTLYETLANEAEVIVKRMAMIVRAIRVRGIYDSSLSEIEKVLEAGEAKLIPCANAEEYRENGGLEKSVWMWPIDTLITTYQALSAQLQAIKAEIFEILGVADIMRGTTDPNETASAQGIKSRWGSIRTRRRQAEVQRFCRDLFRIAGELIAEKFQQQTLEMITGLEFFQTKAQKAQVQQIAAQMQQPPAPPPGANGAGPTAQVPQAGGMPAPSMPPIPPEQLARYQAMLAKPTWEEIIGFLRNDAMRHFRVDVQTDSTIALQESEDQADYAKMMGSVAELVGSMMPMIQQGIMPFDAGKAMLLGLVRKFRLGHDVEDKFAQMKAPQPQTPPKILEIQAKGEVDKQIESAKADAKTQADTAIANAKAQATASAESSRAQADVVIAEHANQMRAQSEEHKAHIKAMSDLVTAIPKMLESAIIQHMKNVGSIEVARINAGADQGQAILEHELTASEQTPAGAQ